MFRVIVLAGGQGKRMKSEWPKVLVPFKGKPMIEYLLASVKRSGIGGSPVIVVGQKADLVKKTLGESYHYIYQPQQLGTGHAVLCAKSFLSGREGHILVLYGDHPLVSAETIRQLTGIHLNQGKVITMGVVKINDFLDWRAPFYQFGRIIRDDEGKIKEIVELKDCRDEQKKITEVNPSFFCFQSDWLWENIEKLNNNNAQAEYYLTDLVGMAIAQGREVAAVEIEAKEALGINTKEQLNLLEKSNGLLFAP